MPAIKNGQEFPCMICGTIFYRPRGLIERGIRKTCGKQECKSESMRGANNPFWGKSHNEETKERIKEAIKRARPYKNKTGPPKGYRHTPEARAKITEALSRRWRENRDVMLAQFAHLKRRRPREDLRYRRNFTSVQREMWRDTKCAWCSSTDQLTLDHIVPVMCGGENERFNAQTLCQPCNMWKMRHVDKPLFSAGLGKKRA